MNAGGRPGQGDSTDRITALEERLTFQQKLLDELNTVVLEQGRQLDRLTRDLARQTDELTRLSALAEGDLPHEKPPHY